MGKRRGRPFYSGRQPLPRRTIADYHNDTSLVKAENIPLGKQNIDPLTKKGNDTFAAAEGDNLLRIHEPLEGNNTLRANGAELVNFVTFGPSGVTTLVNDDFLKLCDARGALFGRAILIYATGRARVAHSSQIVFSRP